MMSGPRPQKKVLIVDDDRDFAEAVEMVLTTAGFTVEIAHDGLEALQILARDPAWNMVLLDLMMPGMNGWEFRVHQVENARFARIPVVAFSGGLNPQKRGALPGIAAFLRKPVSRDDLLTLVHRVCDFPT